MPGQITKPEFSVDQIVARMKEAAARKGQVSDFASSQVIGSAEYRRELAIGGNDVGVDIQPLQLQPPFRPRADSRYHVSDLTRFHDHAFVQHAYRAILRRGPDAHGYRGFLEGLRSARLNKIDVLAQLRYSAEGRAKQVEISGLFVPAMIRKSYRLPVVGYLMNLLIGLYRLPMSIRNQQQFEGHVLAQQEIIADHINHIARVIRSQAGDIRRLISQERADHNERLTRLSESVQQETARMTQELTARLGDFSDKLAKQSDLFTEQSMQLTELKKQSDEHAEHLVDAKQKFTDNLAGMRTELLSRVENQLHQTNESLTALSTSLSENASKWQQEFTKFQFAALQWREQIRVSEEELKQADSDQQQLIASEAANIRSQIESLLERYQQVNTELVLQRQQTANFLTEAGKRLPASFDKRQLEKLSGSASHLLDAFYASFDEKFRGSRQEIKDRLRIYLPFLTEHGVGTKSTPIIDVGCGRGEWLELLYEQRLNATGVETNTMLVGQCRDRGFKVVEKDLIQYLHAQKPGTLGAVTAFHVVEHLDIDSIAQFLDEAVRVLKPGGLVIFETPNPRNVLVGSCNFYFDPTHRNPLPSEVMSFFLTTRGFVDVQVIELNPSDDTPVDDTSDLAQRFNKYFYGPMDYAVVGRRP